MKLNVQLTLDKYEEAKALEELNAWIITYNMVSQIDPDMKTLNTEICDNNDGTIEFRLLDYDFTMEDIKTANESAQRYINSLDFDIDELIKNFGGTN